jgi:hypothetical protein
MRNILACLLFAPLMVSAESIATMGNQGGGKIVLTNETCKVGERVYKSLSRAYNYTSEGYGSEGCFYIEDETVVVVWNSPSGTKQMRYPVDSFTLTKKVKSTSTQI